MENSPSIDSRCTAPKGQLTGKAVLDSSAHTDSNMLLRSIRQSRDSVDEEEEERFLSKECDRGRSRGSDLKHHLKGGLLMIRPPGTLPLSHPQQHQVQVLHTMLLQVLDQTWEGSTDTTLGCAGGAGRVSEYTTSAPAEAAAPAVVESLAASAAALLKLPSSGRAKYGFVERTQNQARALCIHGMIASAHNAKALAATAAAGDESPAVLATVPPPRKGLSRGPWAESGEYCRRGE
ncbi:MAG: hypothetical protein FRX49_09262 [Trebouxia sp. A1-2]|nr:MAG: hypothetical protein FRX49_09262 [Trebouxia sp. A1-2]